MKTWITTLARTAAAVAASAAAMAAPANAAPACAGTSPAHTVALVELYTSEGCDSCPPADKFFSGLREDGVAPEQAVLLSLHVDYWNYIGWKDIYSRAVFSERQRKLANLVGSRTIYTPEMFIGARELRSSKWQGGVQETVKRVNAIPARADIAISALERFEHAYRDRGAAGGRLREVRAQALQRGGGLLVGARIVDPEHAHPLGGLSAAGGVLLGQHVDVVAIQPQPAVGHPRGHPLGGPLALVDVLRRPGDRTGQRSGVEHI